MTMVSPKNRRNASRPPLVRQESFPEANIFLIIDDFVVEVWAAKYL
jgi:hypothetical protein